MLEHFPEVRQVKVFPGTDPRVDGPAPGRVLVVVVPIYAEFTKHVEELRTLARAESIPVVDLPAALEEELATGAGSFFLDAVHPSRRGHREIAKVIYREIEPLVP